MAGIDATEMDAGCTVEKPICPDTFNVEE